MFVSAVPLWSCLVPRMNGSGGATPGGDRLNAEALALRVQVQRQRRTLEVSWAYQYRDRDAQPVACRHCQGSGVVACPFCHGTGVMALGDRLTCSVTARNCDCYACRARGTQRCPRCAGAGFIAAWLATLDDL
jgi:DnaJ-class molecular chaperone